MSKDLNSKVDIATYNSKVTELQNSINSKASKSVATTSADGLMSSADKTKLNGIATNANNYSHPTSNSFNSAKWGGYTIRTGAGATGVAGAITFSW